MGKDELSEQKWGPPSMKMKKTVYILRNAAFNRNVRKRELIDINLNKKV